MVRDPSFLHMDTWVANFKELLRWRFKMNFLYLGCVSSFGTRGHCWGKLENWLFSIYALLWGGVGWGGVGGVSGRGVPMFFSQCRKTCFCSSAFLFYGSRLSKFSYNVLVVKFQISVIYNFTMIRIFTNVPINVSISSNNRHFSIAVHTKITAKLWRHKRWK